MPGKILIASPDETLLQLLQAAVSEIHPDCTPLPASTLEELAEISTTDPEITGVITDIFWNEENHHTTILTYTVFRKEIAWTIASPYDLSEIISAYSPIPALSAPQSTQDVAPLIQFICDDQRAEQLGEYFAEDYSGQNYLGRTYTARHCKIQREVLVTVPPIGSSDNQDQFFRNSASAMARIAHPSIHAIYELGESNGRPFLAHELISDTTLLEYLSNGTRLDCRTIAKILHTVGVSLSYLGNLSIHHFPLGLESITLSESRVVKVSNCATASTTPLIDNATQIATLAESLYSFLPENPQEHDPDLLRLMAISHTGQIELEAFTTEAERIELALAPVKEVVKSQQRIQAEQAGVKARKRRMLVAMFGAIGAAIGAIILTLLLIDKFTPLPATEFLTQYKIPAGKTGEIEVREFYMDEYEVTIGQYERFLHATKDLPLEKILPDGLLAPYSEFPEDQKAAYLKNYRIIKSGIAKREKIKPFQAFEPNDWGAIIDNAAYKGLYKGEIITRDTPVFNVDFIDALAFAHWAGKKIPNEAQWQRAAEGDEKLPFPWGKEWVPTKTNSGADLNPQGTRKPGGLDGYRGPAPVNALSLDSSPFGVKGMAGNVSEWTILVPEMNSDPTSFDPDNQVVRGGDFQRSDPFKNQERLDRRYCGERYPNLGIRLISDKPVAKPTYAD